MVNNQISFFHLSSSVLTTVLDTKQVISGHPAIHESMPLARYPKNTRPTYTQGISRTNPSPSYPRVLGPRPNWDSKPPPLSPGLSAVQGPPPQKRNPNSRSKKSRIHDKRATSLLSAHIQVCAQDNKSVTCLEPNATAGP